jgi:type III secretion protein N (ATPase)
VIPEVPSFDALESIAGEVRRFRARGRIIGSSGTTLTAVLPNARIGEVVEARTIDGALRAEVVAIRDQSVILAPYDRLEGAGRDAEVVRIGSRAVVPCAEGLLGRVLDGLGRPLDGPAPPGLDPYPLDRSPPSVIHRAEIDTALSVGVRAIDALMTLGRGQRVGLFAGPGVGKSTLLDQLASGTSADVVVRCLVGERGREVRAAIAGGVSERVVLVAATSDQPSLVRLRAPLVATAIAEWFRDRGADVLLLVDSLTRFARAQRELGLEIGEPPTRHGYPPSVFSALPRLLERAGPGIRGSITALHTVLVAGGDERDDPIADEARSLLDGHIILGAEVGARGRWPAIDVGRSLSRVMSDVVTAEHIRHAQRVRESIATHERARELIALGAYEPGTDDSTDRAIAAHEEIEAFLRQRRGEIASWTETLQHMEVLAP